MKRELGILRALLRNYRKALSVPKISRALIYANESFSDSFIRSVCRELLLADGNFLTARRALLRNRALPVERITKLSQWAYKIQGGAL